MPDRRQPHTSGPFAGKNADDIEDLDDLVIDAMLDAYVGGHDVDMLEELS